MRAYRWAFLAISLGSTAAFASTDVDVQEDPPAKLAPVSLEQVEPLVKGNTAFALDLYRQLPKDENLFYSPFGVSEALAICFSGAQGGTAAQMASVLGFPEDGRDVEGQFSLLHLVQENLARSSDIDYEMTNSLWSKIALLPTYSDLVEREYGADLFNVQDFSSLITKQRLTDWVSEKTRGKGVFPEKALDDPLLQLVVMNTLYLKASWERQFPKRATKDRPFHLLDGSEVEVPMMMQTGMFQLGKWHDLEVLEMPYKGGELSAIILLPTEKEPAPGEQGLGTTPARTSLAEIEADLTAADLANAIRCTELERVRVFLPRFSISSGLGLKDMLEALGMTDAFSIEHADFSGMTGSTELRIGSLLQNARIDVDETGVEAVAVTVAAMTTRGRPREEPPAKVFRADRPFMFLLRENITGTILFMGRVLDPSITPDEESSDEETG